jgi:hypothetical protein
LAKMRRALSKKESPKDQCDSDTNQHRFNEPG